MRRKTANSGTPCPGGTRQSGGLNFARLHIWRVGAMALSSLCLCLAWSASAMEVGVVDNTLILSGPVVSGDLAKVKSALEAHPGIDHAVLRNSWGGDAWSGFHLGELFRQRGLSTSVSGYCVSSCSRMFLGGVKRYFSDDYPATMTFVGFHGHYGKNGQLNTANILSLGMLDWVLKYTDHKADPTLVRQWTQIELSRGMVAFLHPSAAQTLPSSSYFCVGTERQRPLGCPSLETDALSQGIITETQWLPSPDQQSLSRIAVSAPPASGYAELDDLQKLPLLSAAARENYRRFLASPHPRAFVIAPEKRQWVWHSGSADSPEIALQRCQAKALEPCQLYAVDNTVVYTPPLAPR
jgi:hypothetical protein